MGHWKKVNGRMQWHPKTFVEGAKATDNGGQTLPKGVVVGGNVMINNQHPSSTMRGKVYKVAKISKDRNFIDVHTGSGKTMAIHGSHIEPIKTGDTDGEGAN